MEKVNKPIKIAIYYNGYVDQTNNEKHYKLYVDASKDLNIEVDKILSTDFNFDITKPIDETFKKYEFIIFNDKDIEIAKYFENNKIKVFNYSEAIRKCDNKITTYLNLSNVNLIPTVPVPKRFFELEWNEHQNQLNKIVNYLKFPLVIKEAYGSFGLQVYKVEHLDDLIFKLNQIGQKEILLQKYFPVNNTDYRVYAIGGKIYKILRRHNENDFRSNISRGGSVEVVPNDFDKQINLIVKKVMEDLHLDFAGIDLIYYNNMWYVCEVNSNAHFFNMFRLTGYNFAIDILKHLREKI